MWIPDTLISKKKVKIFTDNQCLKQCFWSTSQFKLSRHKPPDINTVNSKSILESPMNSHNIKGKSIPLQAWSGPEGSRKLRFPDFQSTAQGSGKVFSLMPRPNLPPGNPPGTHFCQRLSRPQGHSAIGRIMSMKNFSDKYEEWWLFTSRQDVTPQRPDLLATPQ